MWVQFTSACLEFLLLCSYFPPVAGKTTLSTDPHRPLIGDDEHCWSQNGIFNIEGGCYAKCVDLNPQLEPEIYHAVRFGAVLENVVFTKNSREVDFSDCSVTENTRAAYPIHFIPNARVPCLGPHPSNIIMLCCDAYGWDSRELVMHSH